MRQGAIGGDAWAWLGRARILLNYNGLRKSRQVRFARFPGDHSRSSPSGADLFLDSQRHGSFGMTARLTPPGSWVPGAVGLTMRDASTPGGVPRNRAWLDRDRIGKPINALG